MAGKGIRRFTIEKKSSKVKEWEGSVNALDPNVYDIFFYACGTFRKAEIKPCGYFPGETLKENGPEYKILKKLVDP